MKYRYLYQTKENRTVEGVVDAASRAEAYAAIRKTGVRPLRVIGDDPKPRVAWKRWVAIAVLAIALVVSLAVIRNERVAASKGNGDRQQILGDQGLIDVSVRTGWARCFPSEGDRLLAACAQPGWMVDRARLAGPDALLKALETEVAASPDDPREFRQVKAIVSQMKVELRKYLADGGTAQGYLDRLHERQIAEVGCYESAARKFAAAEANYLDDALYTLWLKLNADLATMGIKPLPMPERLAK